MRAKLTRVSSSHPKAAERPVICMIPGGPGLSSATLRSMDLLSRSFDLVYVDPPGTGGTEEPKDPTFFSVTDAIERELIALERPVVLCGHSFGALHGIELAQRGRLQIAGLIAIGTPLSAQAYAVAYEQYAKHMTEELRSASDTWDQSPSRVSLANLYASYGVLYFSPESVERGRELLSGDQVSVELFTRLLPVMSRRTPDIDFTGILRSLPIKKYLFAGEVDLMLPPKTLRSDAEAAQCGFFEIQGAGHFITFDQPEAVAALIEEQFIDSERKK